MAEPFNLVRLPEDILIHICSYMSYSQLSACREVCQAFNRICSRELTKAFVKVDRLHAQIQKNIKSKLPRKESERRNHALSRFVDVLSAIETRLSLLSMTYTKYIDLDLCCFIPGKVLDEMFDLLGRLQNTRSQPPRSYDLLKCLRDLSTMAMEHFDEFIVPTLKARMNEQSQSLFFSSPSSSSSSPLHSSIASNSFEISGSVVDLVWPLGSPNSVVNSSWRRIPIKVDMQRMQSQLQMHSSAIATMTKEFQEQKVKVADQSRVIAEQDRQLQEQSRLIQELKAHTQAQENNIDMLVRHLTTLTGKKVSLPQSKPWDQKLWDCSPKASTSTSQESKPVVFPEVLERGLERPQHHAKTKSLPETDAETQRELINPTQCLVQNILSRIALKIQSTVVDNCLPVSLAGTVAEETSNSINHELLAKVVAAQQQLSELNEEHGACTFCSDTSPSSSVCPVTSTSREEAVPGLPSASDQRLISQAQDLYGRLLVMNLPAVLSPNVSPGLKDVVKSNTVKDKGHGKGSLKRGRSVPSPTDLSPEVMGSKATKRRKR